MSKKNILVQSKIKKGLLLFKSGQYAEARILFQQVCESDRVNPDAWCNLGLVNGSLGHFDEACGCFRKAIELNPANLMAQLNLGVMLTQSGKLEEAIEAFKKAMRIDPQNNAVNKYLGSLYLSTGQREQALNYFEKQVRIVPNDVESLVNLGNLLYGEKKLGDALGYLKKAVFLNPANPQAYESLGAIFIQMGDYSQAIENQQRAIQLAERGIGSDISRIHSNLLLSMQYLPELGAVEAFAQHRRWAERHVASMPLPQNHTNTREPERRLRVGYVSSDFRNHSVAFFFEPLLEYHSANNVETFCYSGVPRPDDVTFRLEGLAHHWRNIANLTDHQVEAMVRADGIDILVDLAGHTCGGRLRLFALKPAPVQVNWLGYPDTTGLDMMDYRFTDELADPAGSDQFYAESLVRLPGCFTCYKPLADAPEVASLPALKNGYVTFGSFNNLPKMNAKVVALWAEVLEAVPNSRLFIKSPPLTDLATRERYYELFGQVGINRERLELIGHTATQSDHMDLYKCLDIGLDTFPYNGTTTTCEALWMGVPLVTLEGTRHAGRVGVSLLNAVGMPDFIAKNTSDYVALAANLSSDLPKLAKLRAELRGCLTVSQLCNGKSFASKVEDAYRQMWRTWCKTTQDASIY